MTHIGEMLIRKHNNMEHKIHAKGVIYLIQHKTMPELKYVGQTIDTLGKRWASHMTSFKQYDRMYYRVCFFANYYGTDNFSIRELNLMNNVTQRQLDDEERKYIHELGTLNTRDANEDITIKITDEMRNEYINRLICNKTTLKNINTLIEKFQFNYMGESLGFVVNENNARLLDDMKQSRDCDEMLKGLNLQETDRPSYEKHLDRVNSKQVEALDENGNTKITTEAREQKREYYHTRDKYEMSRKRILREYHSSSRKLTSATMKKYNFTAEELDKYNDVVDGVVVQDIDYDTVVDGVLVKDIDDVESVYEKQRKCAKQHYDKMQETQVKYEYANGKEKETTLAKVKKMEQWKKRMASTETKQNDMMKKYINKYNSHFTQGDKEKIQEITLNKYGLTKFDENGNIKDKL